VLREFLPVIIKLDNEEFKEIRDLEDDNFYPVLINLGNEIFKNIIIAQVPVATALGYGRYYGRYYGRV